MKEKRLFLQWAVMASLIVVGAILAGQMGYDKFVRNDPTHFTYIALAVFAISTAWCGRLAWLLSSGRNPEDIEIDLRLGHYASSLCVSIGLLGTAVGYLMMFQHGTADAAPKEVIKQVFSEASVALVNTVLGGICGVIVEIQSQFINHGVDKAKKLAGSPAAASAEPPKPEARHD